jgi:FAD dependent oxidoreductase
MTRGSTFPVAVIGAGPVGLAAAAHLASRGQPFALLEAGTEAASSVRQWGHVRLFSPWRELIDPVARRLLAQSGWRAPDGDALPTGAELIRNYLGPLAALPAIAGSLQPESRVVAIGRHGLDKLRTAGREDVPFEILVDGRGDMPRRLLARAVIDASGTWGQPNPLASGGHHLPEEQGLAALIAHGIPDVLGPERAHYAGRRVLVAGSGHSAMNIVLDLSRLAREAPGTRAVWVMRKERPTAAFGGGEADGLAARGALGLAARRAVETGAVELVSPFRITGLAQTATGDLLVHGLSGQEPGEMNVDRIVVATGFRPDHGFLREIRLDLDAWLEAPRALAPLIDPNLHSCGTVKPHGAVELAHPERDFYIVGMKSYGRAPTFLLLTGYEQVRSVVAALAGDHEAARRTELVLPETGVCSGGATAEAICCTPLAAPATAPGCCGGPAPAGVDACCVRDADAKTAGEAGCGCGKYAEALPA